MLRLSQSPSLLISGSGSWPEREALALSLAFSVENIKSLPLAPRANENFVFDLQASLGDAPPERGSFFRFLIHERVGIFHEWKSEGREIRLFGLQKGPTGLTVAFCVCEKVEKTF